MKFHNQMIVRSYDHTAQMLYDMKVNAALSTLNFPENDKNVIYQAVLNDYRYREIAKNHIDFFYEETYYDQYIESLEIPVVLNSATAESNIILYHVNIIMDYILEKLKDETKYQFMNLGFVVIDIIKQQLILTDIENRLCTRYRITVHRDISKAIDLSGFPYILEMKYFSKGIEE